MSSIRQKTDPAMLKQLEKAKRRAKMNKRGERQVRRVERVAKSCLLEA